MYPCFAEKFHCENQDYIKKSVISIGIVIVWDIFLYVCSCKQHPFILPKEEWMEQEQCTCAVNGKNEICNFRVEIKHLLNFKAFDFV